MKKDNVSDIVDWYKYGGLIIIGIILLFTKLLFLGVILVIYGGYKICCIIPTKQKIVKDELHFLYDREIQNGKSDIEALSIAAYAWNSSSRLSKALQEVRINKQLIENEKNRCERKKEIDKNLCGIFGNYNGLDFANEITDVFSNSTIEGYERIINENMEIVKEERKLLNI